MKSIELDKVPAYRRAKARGIAIEEHLRAEAFLPIEQNICGIPVVFLTLRILRRLAAARSPFIVGGRVTRGDILAFLWAISPDYSASSKAKRNKGRAELVGKGATLYYRRAIRVIRRYLFYTWMDRPPASRKSLSTPPVVAFDAAMIHHIAKAYGWDDEPIADKPIRCLYQYLTMIRLEDNPKAVTFNPIVDRLTKKILKKLSQRLESNQENGAPMLPS